MPQNVNEEKFAPLVMQPYNASKVTTEGEDNQTPRQISATKVTLPSLINAKT